MKEKCRKGRRREKMVERKKKKSKRSKFGKRKSEEMK